MVQIRYILLKEKPISLLFKLTVCRLFIYVFNGIALHLYSLGFNLHTDSAQAYI